MNRLTLVVMLVVSAIFYWGCSQKSALDGNLVVAPVFSKGSLLVKPTPKIGGALPVPSPTPEKLGKHGVFYDDSAGIPARIRCLQLVPGATNLIDANIQTEISFPWQRENSSVVQVTVLYWQENQKAIFSSKDSKLYFTLLLGKKLVEKPVTNVADIGAIQKLLADSTKQLELWNGLLVTGFKDESFNIEMKQKARLMLLAYHNRPEWILKYLFSSIDSTNNGRLGAIPVA